MQDQIDISERIGRYELLYAREAPRSLVITDFDTGDSGVPAANLTDFDFGRESEHRRYWDLLVDDQLFKIDARKDVDDDWIPGITVHYGFGAFGAIFCDDADLTFTHDTSYLRPALAEWGMLRLPLYSTSRFWSRVFVECASYLSRRGKDRFMVSAYPSPSPLDVANLLRGNEVFTDFFECEDELRTLLDFATEGVIENTREIYKTMDHSIPGVLAFNRWIPQGILLLEDAADLCSPAIYDEFGRPFTQRVIDAMGGAYIHHHSLGRQQFRGMASLSGLSVQQISSDPSQMRPVSDLGLVFEQVGNCVLDLECTVDEIHQYIDEIREHRLVLSVQCDSKEQAQEIVRFVRRS